MIEAEILKELRGINTKLARLVELFEVDPCETEEEEADESDSSRQPLQFPHGRE